LPYNEAFMIQAHNISVQYGSHEVLDEISFTCKPGEHLCVVGANGSGKSTLLRTITALVPLSTGQVRVDGLDPYDASQTRDVRTIVGFVQQRPDDQLVATSVLDEVAFGPENLGCCRKEIYQRCQEALAHVGLSGYEERTPHTLSGGQKQRLVIAGVLAMRPRFIVFDEPTSMLDPLGRAEILAIMRQLKTEGVGIVHVTHDTDEMALADTLLELTPTSEEACETHEVTVHRGACEFEEPSVLKADDIAVTYRLGDQVVDALQGRSLEVKQGELVIVKGPTGSGKSTLLKVLSGLLEPTAGTVSLDGSAITDTRNRGQIGLIFQDAESALFADTVRDDVAFGPRNFDASRADAYRQADEALTAVGLDVEVFGDRSPFHLSGGEARRVAIAGILAFSPRFMLADEPTAGLDSAGKALIIKTLVEATARSGVVVVTHTAEDFLPYASQVISLD